MGAILPIRGRRGLVAASATKKALLFGGNPTFDMNLLDRRLDPRWTFLRSTQGGSFDANGLYSLKAIDVPRFAHDPVTGAALGLNLRKSRQNLALRSGEISDAAWVGARALRIADQAIAPDGNLAADRLQEDGTAASTHYFRCTAAITKAGSALAYSTGFFVKAAERSLVRLWLASDAAFAVGARCDLDASTGAVTNVSSIGGAFTSFSAIATPGGSGFWRVTLTATSDTLTTLYLAAFLLNPINTPSYNGDNASGLYVWGATLEQDAAAGDYMPTAGGITTQGADLLYLTGAPFAQQIDPARGTFVIEFALMAGADGANCPRVMSLSDGATSNELCILLDGPNNRLTLNNRQGGVTDASMQIQAAPGVGAVYRVAFRYGLNDLAVSLNGGAVAADTVCAAPNAPTHLRLNGLGASGSTPSQGDMLIRRFRYWKGRALNDNQLKALSA